MKKYINIKNIVASLLVLFFAGTSSFGSSHREAPLISNDPLADNVDLYAFRSPDNPDMITMIATYVPLQLPHGGPNYYTFGENIRYEIHVDNDASVPGDEITYRFTFNIVNEDPTTFFNIRLGKQNQKATYTLERSMDGGNSFETIITNGVVPPNNIGPRSINSAVGLNTTYGALFNNAITTASTGETVFAGPTDDPFFVDLGGIFDLGDSPRQDGKNVDGLACLNVSAIAIQVPISVLRKASAPAAPTNILDADYVIGVWASASRPAITTLSKENDPSFSGDWVQVSRLGMPLTNEAVIAIGDKDYWNAITPYDEITETTMDEYFYNPELALYMDDSQFGGAVPSFAPLRIQSNSLGSFDFRNGKDGLFGLKGNPALTGTALDDAVFGTLLLPAAGKPRSVDLWPIFHTGVPNVIPYQLATGKEGNPLAAGKPFINNFLPNGGDMLRLNMAVPPTPRDDANFSTLGLVQAAAIGLTVAPFNTTAELEFIPNMDGFPNGRRLEDDVTRIELQAVGGVVLAAVGLWYDDYDPESSPSPVTDDLLGVLTYTTGVESNDKPFTGSFPYLAMPHDGTGPCSGELQFNEQPPLEEADAQVFVSSNTSGKIGVYGFTDDGQVSASTFDAAGADADGIFYDKEDDVLYQLNRSDNVINAYRDVASGSPRLTATSSSDFSNGREIAFSNGKLVVAQDANGGNGMINQFVVYEASGSSISLDKTITTDINLWGIIFDGDNLVAIVDNSNDVAVYNDFLSIPAGNASPSRVIDVNGIVRTHGLDYDKANDVMVLTDVGAASNATDGAISVINNWSTASADNSVRGAEQFTIDGPNSFLGNPVDVAYDHEGGKLYVAERANGGGRFLTFAIPKGDGDVAPIANEFFPGASAVTIADCRDDGNTGGGNNDDAQAIVYYSLDACNSNTGTSQTNIIFDEFTPEYPMALDCSSVSANNVQRTSPASNPHSCTPGVDGSKAMCVSSVNSCTYSPGNDRAVIFNVTLSPTGSSEAFISGLTFFEKAPTTYDWIGGASGVNNYPTKYGLRVLKDGIEIYSNIGLDATNDWTLETFDFSGADFTVDKSTVFSFELLGYCTVGNGASVNAWDLDEITVLGGCKESSSALLSGVLVTEKGKAIEGVQVVNNTNHPEYPVTTISDENGEFEFISNPTGNDYVISALKDDDYTNGVSTLDLVAIQRHILGVEVIASSYEMIAADVNRSMNISAADLVSLRRLILGLDEQLENNYSWLFVNSEQELNAQNPYMFDNSIQVKNLSQNAIDNNFVGVKIGDLTGNVKANSTDNYTEVRTDVSLDLKYQDQEVTRGEVYRVDISSSNFNNVYGFQFTTELNGLELVNIVSNTLDFSENNIGQIRPELITMSYGSAEVVSHDANTVLFTLNLKANKTGTLSEMINISDAITPIEAYVNNSFEEVNVKLEAKGTLNAESGYELFQNTPNPFNRSTDISFNMKQSGQATLIIYDTAGRKLFETKNTFSKGLNTVTIDTEDIMTTSNVLFYQLSAGSFTSTKKMTLID